MWYQARESRWVDSGKTLCRTRWSSFHGQVQSQQDPGLRGRSRWGIPYISSSHSSPTRHRHAWWTEKGTPSFFLRPHRESRKQTCPLERSSRRTWCFRTSRVSLYSSGDYGWISLQNRTLSEESDRTRPALETLSLLASVSSTECSLFTLDSVEPAMPISRICFRSPAFCPFPSNTRNTLFPL